MSGSGIRVSKDPYRDVRHARRRSDRIPCTGDSRSIPAVLAYAFDRSDTEGSTVSVILSDDAVHLIWCDDGIWTIASSYDASNPSDIRTAHGLGVDAGCIETDDCTDLVISVALPGTDAEIRFLASEVEYIGLESSEMRAIPLPHDREGMTACLYLSSLSIKESEPQAHPALRRVLV